MKTNSTQPNLKKYFYTGIGHISHTGDVIQQSAKELSQRGKVTEADGKRIVTNAITEIERKYNEAVHKLLGYTRSEVTTLQTKVAKLEKQIVLKAKKPVAKAIAKPAKASGSSRTHKLVKAHRKAA